MVELEYERKFHLKFQYTYIDVSLNNRTFIFISLACSLEQTALFFRQILILEKSLYSCIREKICNLLTNVINWGIKDFQELMTGEFVIGFSKRKKHTALTIV